MKRLQFGSRLMLLLVALAATIFGWRAAVERHTGKTETVSDLNCNCLPARLKKPGQRM